MSEQSESSDSWRISDAFGTGIGAWRGNSVRLLYVLLLVGIISFLAGAFTSHGRAWQICLVNFLFWSGLSASGVVISAVWRIVDSRWGVVFKRIAEAMTAFLPVSLILFFILLLGRHDWIPWLEHQDPQKAAWLNLPLFVARNAAGILLLYAMSLYFVYLSVRPDVGLAIESRVADASGARGWMVRGWKGLEVEGARRDRILRWYSVALVIVYCLVFSLIGFDFVMSLDREWYSTLFGIYFFVGNLYAGYACVGVLASYYMRRGGLGKIAGPAHLHDQGKLTFAFCMLTGYMLFVQFLVTWYGNLPEEAGFLSRRIGHAPWRGLSPLVALVAVIVPFCVLLSRSFKKRPAGLFVMGLFILLGMWLERYILVVPSLWHEAELPLGWLEAAITAGFLAAALLCYRAFARVFPMVAVTDRLFPGPRRPHTG